MSTPTHAQPFPFRLEFPPELPISARAEEITAAIQTHQVVILAGETGSGKTTQIPKMCLAAGRGVRGRIACTQPRRVAALSISRRVAEELGVTWGREVGCKIRFNDQTTRQTVIKFLTDGMLLAEVQGDPMLRDYDTLILDEAHERSLNIDFLLGHLRTLRYQRPELKIIVTSATIDTESFSQAFDGAPVVQVEGRTFPVEVIYAPLDEFGRDYAENDENEEKDDVSAVTSAKAEALHYIDGAVQAVERIVRESTSGDILVFLPSERDIRELGDLLEGRLHSAIRNPKSAIELVPLFGRLSNAEQQRVFAPTQRRKIVLATNIAETSLTIPGIRFVVDTGLARVSRYSPQARTRRLPIEPVSQSSAEQRKGRSGRVAEGVCIRLYSEKDFLERPRFTQPEIQRANLADVILRMKAFGLGDIERFPFINMPATKAIRAGYALLEELGATVQRGAAAPVGRREEGEGSRNGPAGAKEQGGGNRGDPDAATSSRGVAAGSSNAVASGPAPASPLPSPASAASVELTPLGRELARLPVDPTVGRMILQARAEKALREVLVIAAGLSIQDPRERPLDKQQQADAAHRRFVHRDSDFLTLLNIWDAYHDEFETMTQAKLRRFCRDHFLSYTRMREWRDIHAQLLDTLRDRDDFRMTSVADGVQADDRAATRARETARPERSRQKPPAAADYPLAFGSPAYRAIHRSILAGLLGNVALLDEENGGYKATHDRRVVLFPGSALFRREEKMKKAAGGTPMPRVTGVPPVVGRAPRWIMASEMMETSRLYARTAARIDPQWAIDLGAHLLRVSHSEPFWNEQNGRVMVKQRTRLYGLELESRAVSYGKIDPVHATEIFIREGLVNDTIAFPLDFIAHNRAVREKLEDLLTRTRDSGYLNLDEAVYRFYAAQLLPESKLRGAGAASASGAIHSSSDQAISSVAELVDLVRERRGAEPRFLMMEAGDLRDPEAIAPDADAFPAALPIENRALPLNYAYKPGQDDDGVTLEVTLREAGALTAASLDWAVPGHLEAKVEHYLRALPKELRRGFVPLADTAKSLAAQLASRDRLTGRRESVPEALAAQIAERFRIAIDPDVWADKPPPDHLRVRVRVLDTAGKELMASRELGEIHAALLAHSREASVAVAREDPVAWRAARAKWETPEQSSWNFNETPERVLVTEQAGAPVYAFPGFEVGREGVARRLFKTPEDAAAATERGLSALLERQLGPDLMWTQRDLRALRELGPLTTTLTPVEELQEHAFESIRRWITDPGRVTGKSTMTGLDPARRTSGVALTKKTFDAAFERAKADLRGFVPRFVDLLREILTLRQTLLVLPDPPPGLHRDLAALVPPDFLRVTPYAQLPHFPRYLKAMKLRVERARKNPMKDAERLAQMAPYAAAAEKLRAREGGEAFRWLVEEFRVSLFAQELGTAEPVSTVKLERARAELEAGKPMSRDAAPAAAATVTLKPIVAAPVKDRKPAPIKNLNALDKLFGR